MKRLKKMKKIIHKATADPVEKAGIGFKKHNKMNLLEGKDAVLLAEACKINADKKDLEEKLKKIKEELCLNTKGKYTNLDGDIVTISVTAKKSEIDPKIAYDYFKKRKILNRFWSCLKVQLTPLKKVVPSNIIESWRFDLDPIIKHTFQKRTK